MTPWETGLQMMSGNPFDISVFERDVKQQRDHSDRKAKMSEVILACVTANPGTTVANMVELVCKSHRHIHRYLRDLEAAGKVRKDQGEPGFGGTIPSLWYPSDAQVPERKRMSPSEAIAAIKQKTADRIEQFWKLVAKRPGLQAKELARRYGCSNRSAQEYLKQLHTEGRVTKEIKGLGYVWYATVDDKVTW